MTNSTSRVDNVIMWSNKNIAQLNAELQERLEIAKKNLHAVSDDFINEYHIRKIEKDIDFFKHILAEAEYHQYHGQIWMNLSEPRDFYIWFMNRGVRDAV